MTTITITDPHTIDYKLLAEFYTSKTTGRTDVWLDTYEEERQTERMGLFNGEVQFDSDGAFEARLCGSLYGGTGKRIALVSIFDDGKDADAFQDLLTKHSTPFTTTFDITPTMMRQLDSEEVHDWLAANVKHKAIIWKTEGDNERTHSRNNSFEDIANGAPPYDEISVFTRWIDDEETTIIGKYEPANQYAYPALSFLRLAHWPFEDYLVVRIMFTDPTEATLFKLTFAPKAVSTENGIEPEGYSW